MDYITSLQIDLFIWLLNALRDQIIDEKYIDLDFMYDLIRTVGKLEAMFENLKPEVAND